jgi:hypothetical protein
MSKHRVIHAGDVIENLEILENLGYRKYCKETTTYWKCRCTRCGTIIEVPQKNLGTAQKDCGCQRRQLRKPIPIGTVFGRLKVIGLGSVTDGHGYTYLCECSCEKHTRLYVRGDSLQSGGTSSCGCLHNDLFKKVIKTAHKINYVDNTCINVILTDKPQSNNTSGVRGVTWHKGAKKWAASIQYKKRKYYLGYYDDLSEAERVVSEARKHVLVDFVAWYSEKYPEQYKKIEDKINNLMSASSSKICGNSDSQ